MARDRVLVTGAGGTVGRATVAALLAGDAPPAILATDLSARALACFGPGVEVAAGDIADPATLAGKLGGVTAAIHLAAVIPPLADARPDLADRVNIGGTRALLETLAREAPGAFFVHGSSIAVYGDRCADPDIRLGDPLAPSEGDHYATTKIAGEDAVRAGPLDWTILRLSAVMGGHRMTPLMFHMPLDTRLEILTPGDAGRALAAARHHRAALTGKTFNLGGGAACRTTFRAYLTEVFTRIGLGRFDLPEAAFATRNFHCGYYADGDALDDILHFRRDTLAGHLDELAAGWPWWRRAALALVRRPAKAYLAARSEPLAALRAGDAGLIRRFYGLNPPDVP